MFTSSQHTLPASRHIKGARGVPASAAKQPPCTAERLPFATAISDSSINASRVSTSDIDTSSVDTSSISASSISASKRLRRAFTLAEVLIAMTLFTLLVVAVGQNISNNMRALAQMNSGGWDTPSMRAIREHILNLRSREAVEEGGEIELAGWPKPGDTATTNAAQPTKIRWTAEINPTSTLDLYTLTIELQVDNASDDPIEAGFITHVYRPGWGRMEDRERIVEAKNERLEAVRTARGEKRKESQ